MEDGLEVSSSPILGEGQLIVLILIWLEDGLEAPILGEGQLIWAVLILIWLEDGLEEYIKYTV